MERLLVSPFISFYTPTYRRPKQLSACLASVSAQRGIEPGTIEQVVIADHVGVGIDGMYARVASYAEALHGIYVHFLSDDDVLAGPHVVADRCPALLPR